MQYLEGIDELVLRLYRLLGQIFRNPVNSVVMGSSSAKLFHPLTLFGCVFAVNARKIAMWDPREKSLSRWLKTRGSSEAQNCISSILKRDLTKCCSPRSFANWEPERLRWICLILGLFLCLLRILA